MQQDKIQPSQVTKPIQLLAAWLVGLVSTNASFLFSASALVGRWESSALVIAAIANVPIFLLALFILQTKFRAELQEDTYYSEYLSKKTSHLLKIDKNSEQDLRISRIEEHFFSSKEHIAIEKGIFDWERWKVGVNEYHSKYSQVRKTLKENNVTISNIFGVKKNAETWIIALNERMPYDQMLLILRLMIPLGFSSIDLWEPMREADENEDVYIGAYGSASIRLSVENQNKILDKNSEAADLERIFSKLKE